MSKTTRQRRQPARPRRRLSASTASATTCSPTRRTARTATSPTRGWSAATTPTSPTTSATSLSRVATVVDVEVRRHRAGAVAGQPARRRRGRRRRRRGRGVGRRAAEPRARGDVVADPGDERPPRGERAVEDRARPGRRRRARRRARGAAHRDDPGLAGDARDGAGDLGAHRAAPARSPTSASPTPSAWGGYPGGLAGHQGPRRSSRASRHDRRSPAGSTRTATSPAERRRRASSPRPRAAGVTTMVTVGCDRASSIDGARRRRPVRRRAARRSGCTRTRPPRRRHDRRPPRRAGAAGRRRRVRARLPLRPLAARRPSATRSRRRSRSPTSSACRSSSTPARRGTTRSTSSTPRACRRRTIFHCFTGGPDEARRCLDRGAYLSFSGIVTFNGAPEVREAAAIVPARPPARRDRQPVPGARSPPGQAQPAGLGAVRRGPPGRRARRRRRRDPRRRRDATLNGCSASADVALAFCGPRFRSIFSSFTRTGTGDRSPGQGATPEVRRS